MAFRKTGIGLFDRNILTDEDFLPNININSNGWF